jgi:hypothetical protein
MIPITLRMHGCRLPFGVPIEQALLTAGGTDARTTWIEITAEGGCPVDQ